ncbi:MAG: carbohydrate-binding protein [Thermoguttaceae bacterium]
MNVRVVDNVFHRDFTRTSSQLTADDFPGGKPFRFGHDFASPPPLPKWPQLIAHELPMAAGSLKDGEVIDLGTVDFGAGWQSAVVRLNSTAAGLNSVPSFRKSVVGKDDKAGGFVPRHQRTTDPLVLDSIQNDGVSEGLKVRWTFLYGVGNGASVRFNAVPLGEGYGRFRVVYGNMSEAPARVEVRLDGAEGPLAGQVELSKSDDPPPPGQQVCIYNEATAELATDATGTRDVFLVFRSESEKPPIAFEYLRFEQYRGTIPLQKNEARLELRAGSKDGPKLGELCPRPTGGDQVFREFAAALEPAKGPQRLFLVARSALEKPLGTIAGVWLEKSADPIDWTGIGEPPLVRDGKMVLPEPTNLPQSRPNDRFVVQPAKGK